MLSPARSGGASGVSTTALLAVELAAALSGLSLLFSPKSLSEYTGDAFDAGSSAKGLGAGHVAGVFGEGSGRVMSLLTLQLLRR